MKMGIFSAYELAMEGVQARSHFPEFIARFNNLEEKRLYRTEKLWAQVDRTHIALPEKFRGQPEKVGKIPQK